MRKLLVFISIFIFISCQQDSLNSIDDSSDNESLKSIKKTSTTNSLNPLSQLEGIPINILQPNGVTRYRYLGYANNQPTAEGVILDIAKLFDRDDNSGYQR